MRILFDFAGGSGHAEPLVPVARAAAEAGHTVAFSGRPAVVAPLAERGFAVFPSGRDASVPARRTPLLPLDPAREDRDLREGFAGRIAREREAVVEELAREWRPDVLVCDETDFGATAAAERLELPYAVVLVIAAGSFVRREVVGDAAIERLVRGLVLSPFPPSLRDPSFPLPPGAQSFRPLDVPPSEAGRARPLVYFSLGTVFAMESGDLFERVLAGLGELDVDAVATTGPGLDPSELGDVPPNVRVERFVPQAEVLPRCDAVISHGGSGGVLGALAHGLPLVLLPLGADQPLNAARCAELGVARVLDALRATPAEVRDAVADVLAVGSYRQAAERLAGELAGLPPAASTVPLLERLQHRA